ncbi:MAG: 6-pyruvoyl trahydropterin synthase family protein [Endozoicomonas sp.]
MTALFVKQLTTLDFSYLNPKRGLVGETWLVDVTLTGDLDKRGMVFDFGHVKKQVKASLDTLADHRLLVPMATSETEIERNHGQLTVRFQGKSGDIVCTTPAQAMLLVDAQQITPETLKPILETELLKELPDSVEGVSLHLYPEEIGGAYYHYSHGLKKHLGDCQRIAHGHRSQIRVFVDQQRDQVLEAFWSKRWRDIYIATREDLKETFYVCQTEYYCFSYTSGQGYFELKIPSSDCYLIDTDTTVELLAEHMAAELSRKKGQDREIEVIAFEGLNKGAIASLPMH